MNLGQVRVREVKINVLQEQQTSLGQNAPEGRYFFVCYTGARTNAHQTNAHRKSAVHTRTNAHCVSMACKWTQTYF